jgi:lantibiotic modifying enzyme
VGLHKTSPTIIFYMKDTIKILEEISVTLDNYTKQETFPGLLSGYSGSALFYAYYYNLTGKKKHLKKVHQLLLKSIQTLSEETLIASHCNGVAGIVWTIQHLINEGFASEDGLEDTFEEVDQLLGIVMEQQIAEGEYDFLHQGLGIALYFLEKEQPSVYLHTLVKLLEKTAYQDERGLRWQDHFSRTQEERPEEPAFNLGMAHGVPAIISILGKIQQKGIDVSPLLEQSINWLLSTKNKPEEGISSLYPVLVNTHNEAMTGKQSRMGWCYGDLSIATTLLNTGYKEEAHKIFTYSLQHRNEQNGSVYDACLCHGTAGISHIFRRAYLSIGDPLLLEGAEHWLQQTLQMDVFKSYAEGKYENSFGMLEGITGSGLALIAAVDPATAPAWDRCLLLS